MHTAHAYWLTLITALVASVGAVLSTAVPTAAAAADLTLTEGLFCPAPTGAQTASRIHA